MDIEIINKLDEITKIINEDKDLKRKRQLEKKIEENKDLMNKINEIKKMSTYDPNYLKKKEEVINNKDFKEYKELEKEEYLLILEINKRLNSLKEKSECN